MFELVSFLQCFIFVENAAEAWNVGTFLEFFLKCN